MIKTDYFSFLEIQIYMQMMTHTEQEREKKHSAVDRFQSRKQPTLQ